MSTSSNCIVTTKTHRNSSMSLQHPAELDSPQQDGSM